MFEEPNWMNPNCVQGLRFLIKTYTENINLIHNLNKTPFFEWLSIFMNFFVTTQGKQKKVYLMNPIFFNFLK